MAVIEYLEFDTAPLPLGPEAVASTSQNRQSGGPVGTQPEPSDIAKAESE